MKETVDDNNFDYERANSDNINRILEELQSSPRIGIRFYSKDSKITQIGVSNGKNFCFPEEFIQHLKPIIENPIIKNHIRIFKINLNASIVFSLFIILCFL